MTKDGRPAPNEGIYPAVSAKECVPTTASMPTPPQLIRACRWKAKRTYKRYQIAINTALGFQLVLSAAITALGASNSSHSTITGFGAINTVCAGFLTYLKGSGVPQRFKYYASEWKQLREYIEQREVCIEPDEPSPVACNVLLTDDFFHVAARHWCILDQNRHP